MADDLIQIGIQVDTRSLVDAKNQLKSFQSGVTGAIKGTKALERNVKLVSDSFKSGNLTQRQYYKALSELADASNRGEAELRKYANQLRAAERASAAAAAQAKLEAQARKDAAAAARVAAAAQRAATQAAAEAAKAARTQADANRRLRMEFREGYAAQVALRAAQMRLNQARREGIVTDQEYQRQLARLSEINRGNVRGTNNLGVAMQQTGYQVGDFAIQVQGGTNIAVAFGQQATQLIGVLYLLPPATLAISKSILGLRISVMALIASFSIILPIVTGVVAYFMRARESAKEAAGGIETLEDQLKSAKNATSGLSDEIERLNMGFKDTAEQAFSRAVKETADAILEIQGKLNTLFDDGPKRGSSNVAREYREEIAALNELLSARRIDLETYIQTRAELARIKELEEGRIASVKLFFEYAQRDLELAKERSEAVDAIRASVDGEVKSLESQIALNKEILRFGEDSAQVAALKASQDRESYMLQQQAAGILGNNLKTVMDTYDELVSTEATLKESATAAQQLADALNSAAVFSGNLDKSVDALRARLAEAKGEQGAVLANTIEQMRAEARLNAARIRATQGEVEARAQLAIDQAQIDEYAKLTTEVESAADASKGAAKALSEAKRALEAARKAAEELRKELESPLVSAIGSVSNAFGDFISRGLTDFKGFVQQILGSFQSMISQMIAMAVKNRIMLSLGVGGITPAAAQAGQVAGLGSAGGMLGSLGTGAGVAGIAGGTGLLGGAGNAVAGLGGGGAGFFSVGANAAAAGGGAMATIGAAIPVLAAVAVAVSLFRKKTKELDSGLNVTVKNMDALVTSFKTVQTSRFFGLSKKTSTSTGGVSSGVSDPIVAAVQQIQQSVLTAAEAFGFGADAFDNFSYQFKLSLKGLSEEQQMQKINEELAKMGDSFASLTGHFSSMNELLEAAEQRYQIENRMLEALGNSSELLARNRERELAATHALNRGLLQATFDLEDANAAVSSAMDGLRRAIDAEKTALQTSFDAVFDGLRERLDLATEAVSRSRNIFNMLSNSLKSRSLGTMEESMFRRSSALSFLQSGDISDEKKLESALQVVSEPSEGLFTSFVDYAREFLQTSRVIGDLENTAAIQLSADEKAVVLLEQQIEANKAALDSQLAALEQQYQTEIDQYNALMGIDTSVKSVGEAIATLRGALEGLASARAAAKAAAAAPAPSAPSTPAAAAPDYQLVKEGKYWVQRFSDGDYFRTGHRNQALASQAAATNAALKAGQQFARGGMFNGGMRLVGEEGPELEVTGPSRIYSKQQTKELLRGGDSSDGEGLRAEVSEMRQELRQLLIANNKYTKRSYDLYNKWDIDGLPAERT